ncbi:GTP cyclohydrolase II [Thalassoroseus pseudoceratinae]|uniref:GTP cyclohydrolase II n=1 Tax=Thalassoroseus pseudoceratinae TaxID=2713176 RepID=UPI001421BA09|nr:GTP cyclohydrolase II [Thalassoroseus pseudoceratinae]
MTDAKRSEFNMVEKAVESLRAGKMVIVVDAAERENEGDFVCAAENVTPEMVHFMLSHGMGVFCTPMSQEVADRLHLTPMVQQEQNTAPHSTPFLVPIDHRDAGTGVSPESRALTVQKLADPNSTPAEFLRPGHVSPLLAKEGGVLRRAGHTEATVDLMRLAGLKPVGCLIEICSRSGRGMADFDELQEIGAEHDIPIISIEELIRYRRVREQLIHREAEVVIPTGHYGDPNLIGYRVAHESQEPLAIVWGDLKNAEKPPLVRMHSSCFTGDLLDSLRCDCGDQLHLAMKAIHEQGSGAIVYLPQEGRGIGLMAKLKAYQLQDQGRDTVEANEMLGFQADHRDYMVGLQILKDLGLTKIRLLTNNPKKTDAFTLAGMDLEVVEQVPLIAPPPHNHRERYLATKRDKMGHQFPTEEVTESE